MTTFFGYAKFDQTDREVFESTLEAALSSGDIPELKSTQGIDKYADFIVTAISPTVDKAIPTSKSRHPESQPVSDTLLRRGSALRTEHPGSEHGAKCHGDRARSPSVFPLLIGRGQTVKRP